MGDYSIPQLLKSTLATGDIIYKHSTLIWQRLAIGSTNNLLGVTGGVPVWGTLVSWMEALSSTRGALARRGSSAWEALAKATTQSMALSTDGTDTLWVELYTIMKSAVGGTFANGDIIYSTGSALSRLAAGTAGYILQANGAAAPTWVKKGIRLVASRVAGSVDSFSFSSLTGDTDKIWILFFRIKNGSGGTRAYVLNPNAATTNQNAEGGYDTGGASGHDSFTVFKLINALADTRLGWGVSFLWTSKSDNGVAMVMHGMTAWAKTDTSATDLTAGFIAQQWNASGEVTSIEIKGDGASSASIASGSSFYLYALEMP